jgi:hypothetical protein
MSRAVGPLLGLVAAAAAGALYLELRPEPPLAATRPAPQVARVAAAPTVAEAGDDQVALILARPLFNPTRRPAGLAAIAEAGVGLPRLAGIVIDEAGRSAIFAAADSAKPLVLREGGRLGGWSVRTIEAAAVTLDGPDGTRVLHLGFAKRAAPESGPQPAPPLRPARAAWAGAR